MTPNAIFATQVLAWAGLFGLSWWMVAIVIRAVKRRRIREAARRRNYYEGDHVIPIKQIDRRPSSQRQVVAPWTPSYRRYTPNEVSNRSRRSDCLSDSDSWSMVNVALNAGNTDPPADTGFKGHGGHFGGAGGTGGWGNDSPPDSAPSGGGYDSGPSDSGGGGGDVGGGGGGTD